MLYSVRWLFPQPPQDRCGVRHPFTTTTMTYVAAVAVLLAISATGE